MNMKMILEEELRPAIQFCDDFNLKVLVHTTNQSRGGWYLTEMKDGNLAYTPPDTMVFLDSEQKFNEFAWDTSKLYSKNIDLKPTFETIKEIEDWSRNNS